MTKINDKQSKWMTPDSDDLFKAILKLKDTDEARAFFRDLLTANEIVEFGQRWKVAQMLAEGISYTKIAEETGMSSTTIARVHKWLKKGMGGYKLILKRLR